jgi:hypothetical protein
MNRFPLLSLHRFKFGVLENQAKQQKHKKLGASYSVTLALPQCFSVFIFNASTPQVTQDFDRLSRVFHFATSFKLLSNYCHTLSVANRDRLT